MRRLPLFLALLCGLPPVLAQAAPPTPPDFQPDPRSVQRYGPAYRYPQSGWIVLHIEGEPYERGVQHGRLLAPEIAAQIRCLAQRQSPKSPADGWKATRTLVNSLFVRRYDKEYLEEMKGIADGASAAGARFDDREIDLIDIVAVNAWAEIMTLDSALDAEPTGVEGLRREPPGADAPGSPAPAPARPKPERCSAFAAVGPATADGKIVFGHITMYLLYESSFFNVWLDVKSAKGHRVFMQSYPGGIQSGLDYYLNDAGLLVSETTIAQTRFDGTGLAVASRIRKALQYADGIDKAVEILKGENNGLYTNEWLLADVNTNEIAMFELGTHKSKLYRSSKNEWFGGTEGFYWGCNNTKDLDVRLETIDDVKAGRPGSAVFHPSNRDIKWLELYDKSKGKIDADWGKTAFTTAPIASYHSVDAKFTTSDMAKDLKTWALFGPPLGRTWQPTNEEHENFPEIRPLVGNPWVVLHAGPPADARPAGPAVVDLPKLDQKNPQEEKAKEAHKRPETQAAWHGTLLPKSDADVWLASAFQEYERIAALDNAYRKRDGSLTPEDRDDLAALLYQKRADYNLGARAHPEATLNDTKSDLRQGDWHRVASGKGVLVLHDLRMRLGAEKFDSLMEQFGREHGGKPTGADEFQTFLVEHTGPDSKDIDGRLAGWRTAPGLPRFQAGGAYTTQTFNAEPERTLIVYGAADEANVNREAAEALQQAIRARGSNVTVPIRSDGEVTEDDLKTHHLLLIGRPGCNKLTARFAGDWPVAFGPESFVARDEAYAHADSAVLAAAENPLNRRYSVVVIAGLGAAATLRAAPLLMDSSLEAAEVVVLPHDRPARSLTILARDWVRRLEGVKAEK